MKVFLSILCVALVTQLGAVLGESDQNIPDRFKVVQGLKFHQDAGDKAATRSITSPEAALLSANGLQTPLTGNFEDQESRAQEDVAEEANPKENVEEESMADEVDDVRAAEDVKEEQLATRSIDDVARDNDVEASEECDGHDAHDENHELHTRGLFDSAASLLPSSIRETAENLSQKAAGMVPSSIRETAENLSQKAAGMVPTNLRETAANLAQKASGFMPTNMRETAANLSQHAANLRNTAASMIQNPKAAGESIHKALVDAKERMLSPEMREKVQQYKTGVVEQGVNAYQELNNRLSPGMARALNHGVASTIRGVQTVKESPVMKTISDKVSSLLQ